MPLPDRTFREAIAFRVGFNHGGASEVAFPYPDVKERYVAALKYGKRMTPGLATERERFAYKLGHALGFFISADPKRIDELPDEYRERVLERLGAAHRLFPTLAADLTAPYAAERAAKAGNA